MSQAHVLINGYGGALGTLTDGLIEQRFACQYWSPVAQNEPQPHSVSLDVLIVLGPLPIHRAGPAKALDPCQDSRFHVFKWHQCSFDCTDGAAPLAVGAAGIWEAFSFLDDVLVTRFHIEAASNLFQGWMLASLQGLEGKTQALHDAVKMQGLSIEAASCTAFRGWLAQVVGKRALQTPSVLKAVTERGVVDAV